MTKRLLKQRNDVSIEALSFIAIVLLVWMIANIGSWLREQIERYARHQEAFEAREALPLSPDSGSVPLQGVTAEPPEPIPTHGLARQSLKRPARLRYRSRRAARQGVILMTVFGPCKALESRDEF